MGPLWAVATGREMSLASIKMVNQNAESFVIYLHACDPQQHHHSPTPLQPRTTMAAVIDLTVMSHFSHFNTPIPSGTVIDLTAEELHEVTETCLNNSLGTKRARSTESPLPAKKRSRLDAFLDPNGSMEDEEASSDNSVEDPMDDLQDCLVFDSDVFDSYAARLVKGGMPMSVAKSFARRMCRLPDYDRSALVRIMARMEAAKKPLSAALHEEFLKELHFREECQSDEEEVEDQSDVEDEEEVEDEEDQSEVEDEEDQSDESTVVEDE